MPDRKTRTTVGDLLRALENRKHRFHQIQAVEKAVTGDKTLLAAVTRILEDGGYLRDGEDVPGLLAAIRSEEYQRLCAFKETIYGIETTDITSVQIKTADGRIEMSKPAGPC